MLPIITSLLVSQMMKWFCQPMVLIPLLPTSSGTLLDLARFPPKHFPSFKISFTLVHSAFTQLIVEREKTQMSNILIGFLIHLKYSLLILPFPFVCLFVVFCLFIWIYGDDIG